MKHFHRTQLPPDDVLAMADQFFPTIGLQRTGSEARARAFAGELGRLTLMVRSEGGHYVFVEAHTDQMGESRMDRNVKKFFVRLHGAVHPRRAIDAAY